MQNPDDRHSRKQAKAYEIWEREGRPLGRDLDHWLMAETEVGNELPPAQKPIDTVLPGIKSTPRRTTVRGRKAS